MSDAASLPNKIAVGAVFAGGRSRRMGEPKAGKCLWDGRPMIEHVLDALAPLCEKLVVVGDCQGYEVARYPELTLLPDLHPGKGPLAALEALLTSGLADRYLVVSCDQPLLTPEVLEPLLAGAEQAPAEVVSIFFQSEAGEALDPFPGVYSKRLWTSVRSALDEGRYALRPVLKEQPIHWVTLPDALQERLRSANTPQILAEMEEVLGLSQVMR